MICYDRDGYELYLHDVVWDDKGVQWWIVDYEIYNSKYKLKCYDGHSYCWRWQDELINVN